MDAEPGIGKSVATAMALLNYTQKSAVTVLLQGDFQKNLRGFVRVADAADAIDVASELFRIQTDPGIRLQMVFDRGVLEGCEDIYWKGREGSEHDPLAGGNRWTSRNI